MTCDYLESNPLPCGWVSNAINGPTGFGERSGASWASLWSGNATGALNDVGPRFTNASVSDQFRPNDKLLINAAVRYDNFTYNLPNSATAATQFYANQTANYTCVQASTNSVLTNPLAAGQPPPAAAIYVRGDCNAAVAALLPGRAENRLGSSQRKDARRRRGPELHGFLARVVQPELLAAAFLGYVHDESRHRHPRFGGPLHAAADLGIGSIPLRVGR